MARFFTGDPSRIEDRLREQLETLPDDFWVLAEVTLTRNHDFIIIRPHEDAPATFINTEVKRAAGPLKGSVHSHWEMQIGGGGWQPTPGGNPEDKNPYWQAVNGANSLALWLHNNSPVFNDGDVGPWGDVKVWPDLVLLSPPGTRHQLPLRPDSGYGLWFSDVHRWIEHVIDWKPRVGAALTHDDIQRLVDFLQLTPLSPARIAETRVVPAESRITALEQAVLSLQERIARLERVRPAAPDESAAS
jgi:hypothetical protein